MGLLFKLGQFWWVLIPSLELLKSHPKGRRFKEIFGSKTTVGLRSQKLQIKFTCLKPIYIDYSYIPSCIKKGVIFINSLINIEILYIIDINKHHVFSFIWYTNESYRE